MKSAIIVCAGNSSRFSGGRENKTLYLFEGKPIFLYSVNVFERLNFDLIVIVIKAEEKKSFDKYLNPKMKIAYGGPRRQDSVLNALDLVPADSEVLVHDGARPFLTDKIVKDVLSEIRSKRCVVPAIKSEDTIRIENAGKYTLFDRNKVFRMQTPQGCIAGELAGLYKKFSHIDLLDDASAFELEGFEVKLVDGDKKNIKITTKEDLKILQALL
ncbi:IspD/TarI family cytidylyltransferase [Athalassotoga sp.]|uniref:IspD/TarI family cytidylyltransferase n=1 Tax=Athalassotoga sp. TaxID=2022597 RepID=UPI003D0262A9